MNHTQQLAKGIVFRSTPSHGYVELSAARLAEMPEVLQTVTDFYRGDGSFEEDCEWSRVALAFPEAFTVDQVALAHNILKKYQPEIYRVWSEAQSSE